jgi:uncharacterized protein (DUF885 family)
LPLVTETDPSTDLTRLGDTYFELTLDADPLYATMLGIDGRDAAMPDPSRQADRAVAASLDRLATELAAVDGAALAGEEKITHSVLSRLLADNRDTRLAGLFEVGASASTFGMLSEVLATVPLASLTSPDRAGAYLGRLGEVGGFFDALLHRYRQAAGEGRTPTALGARQLVHQIDDYLATEPRSDPFLRPDPAAAGVDPERWRSRAAELVAGTVRPALVRFRDGVAELAERGRDDAHVGAGHLPGGPEGYLAAVRANTTTDLTPEEIHRTGVELLAGLREEIAELGGRALGVTDPPEVFRRLRDDPALRFGSTQQVLDESGAALAAAYDALPDWFRPYPGLAPCEITVMDPLEAAGGVPGYYMPPAADGSRAGQFVMSTLDPADRPRFEQQALTFHESVPGHHLQVAVGQARHGLPAFRRFALVNAHVEGWGLYAERLADEMGLYSSDLSRLGMLSFDCWRACRLVVDTGMHALGWSRTRAIGFMRANTALMDSTVANEVDRYIVGPGQALGYMTGRLRIQQLRERARAALGPAFDLRDYHHEVLAHGSVPLGTLDAIVDGWITRVR